MTVVVDASALVAALVDSGPDGRWAETLLVGNLAAPRIVCAEVANVLRRAARAGQISDDIASMAHADMLDLRIQFVSYEVVADRIWGLRRNLTAYDAWYVAAAELLDVPLATLDQRLVNSPGPRCAFMAPGRSTG